MSEVLDLLVKARGYLTGPEKWCRYYRHDGLGGRCALGLLDKASMEFRACSPSDAPPPYTKAVEALLSGVPNPDQYAYKQDKFKSPIGPEHASSRSFLIVANYNNEHDYETVRSWFDRTIEVLKLQTQEAPPFAPVSEPELV